MDAQGTPPSGRACTTLELKMNLVRAIGPDGRLYAHATTTCLIFDTLP